MTRLLIVFFLLMTQIRSIKFSFELKANNQRCFKETLPLNTNIVGEATSLISYIPDFRILITDEKKYSIIDKRITHDTFHNKLNELKDKQRTENPSSFSSETELEQIIIRDQRAALYKIKFAFSTQVEGVTYFCLFNKETVDNTFDFEISHGIDAKDYSNIAKKQNLKPTETEILRVEDFVKEMKGAAESIWVKESHKLEMSESFNSSLLWTSLFGIVVIIAFGAFEYYIIKSYFKQKKLI